MRLTLRCVLSALRGVEGSLEEIANKLQDTPYKEQVKNCVQVARIARQELHNLLDAMIDNGFGD